MVGCLLVDKFRSFVSQWDEKSSSVHRIHTEPLLTSKNVLVTNCSICSIAVKLHFSLFRRLTMFVQSITIPHPSIAPHFSRGESISFVQSSIGVVDQSTRTDPLRVEHVDLCISTNGEDFSNLLSRCFHSFGLIRRRWTIVSGILLDEFHLSRQWTTTANLRPIENEILSSERRTRRGSSTRSAHPTTTMTMTITSLHSHWFVSSPMFGSVSSSSQQSSPSSHPRRNDI